MMKIRQMKNVKRVRAGLYLVHDVYVHREHVLRRNLLCVQRTKIWQAYCYYDNHNDVVQNKIELGVFASLEEAESKLRPRPAKLGTLSSFSYQVIGTCLPGNSVVYREAELKGAKWQRAIVHELRDDGFLFLDQR